MKRKAAPRKKLTDRDEMTPIPSNPIRDPVAIGVLIRNRRKESKATLTEAAGLAGVGVRFLHELEHGKSTASLGKVLQVLERVGLELWIVPRGKRLREE